jgi:hypothetical protein
MLFGRRRNRREAMIGGYEFNRAARSAYCNMDARIMEAGQKLELAEVCAACRSDRRYLDSKYAVDAT